MTYDREAGRLANARTMLEQQWTARRRAWAHRLAMQAQAQFPGSVVIVRDGGECLRFDSVPGRVDPECIVIPEPMVAAMVWQAAGRGVVIVIVDGEAHRPPDRLSDTWGMPIVELRLCGAAAADPIQAMQTHQAASESLWRLGEC